MRRTKAALGAAVVDLIAEKGYDAVTVQDIIDRADVARSTFYGHYRDKDELLLDGLQNIRPALESEAAPVALGFSLPLFVHARSYRRFYRAVAGNRAGRLMLESITTLLTDLVRTDLPRLLPRGSDIPPDVAVGFVVNTYLAVLDAWLASPQPAPAEEVDRWFRQLAFSGLGAA